MSRDRFECHVTFHSLYEPCTSCSRDNEVGPRDARFKAGWEPSSEDTCTRGSPRDYLQCINGVSRDLFLYFTLHVTYYVYYDAHHVLFMLSRDYFCKFLKLSL